MRVSRSVSNGHAMALADFSSRQKQMIMNLLSSALQTSKERPNLIRKLEFTLPSAE